MNLTPYKETFASSFSSVHGIMFGATPKRLPPEMFLVILRHCTWKALWIFTLTSRTHRGIAIEEIQRRAKDIENIHVSIVNAVEDNLPYFLACLLNHVQWPARLNLAYCNQVTDVGLLAIGAGCPALTSLNLRGCWRLTDAGLSAIGAGCPALTSLNLRGCDQVTDAGLSTIGAGCPALTSLNLTDCELVTDVGLSAIGAGCPALTSLNLAYCNRVTDAGLSAVRAARPDLRIYH